MNDPRQFKAPYNPKERIWHESDRLCAAHSAGRELPVKILDLAEFDLHLDLVPVHGLREQLEIGALLMGDLKSILVDKPAGYSDWLAADEAALDCITTHRPKVRRLCGSDCETLACGKPLATCVNFNKIITSL